MLAYIYTDGAARGNPGKSASGYLILDSRQKVMAKASIYNGIKTNNFAEYNAAVLALTKALEFGKFQIKFTSDSELMVNQLNGLYKVKDPELKKLNSKVKALAMQQESVEFVHVPRSNKYISMVDKALNELLDGLDSIKKSASHIDKRGLQTTL